MFSATPLPNRGLRQETTAVLLQQAKLFHLHLWAPEWKEDDGAKECSLGLSSL